MDIQTLLAALLNPNGAQQAPQMAGAPTPVGDRAGMVQQRLGGMPQMQPPQMPQQQAMPPQAPQGQPMPQSAPQAASQPQGGGLGAIGGILQNIIAPQSAQKNATVAWLTKQGYDPGAATVLASDKTALRQVILARGQGEKPTGEIQNYLFAKQDGYKGTFADFSGKKAPDREIKNDANGTPRFVDTGEPVYPGDQNTGKEMFTGKSVEAQGLNYLIAQGSLTKEQASNVAAGKPVTGPNGEIIFMTPQGIFQQPPDGSAPTPVQGGNIPITGPKYSEDMRKAGGFAMRADAADKIVGDPKVTAAGESYGQNLMNAAPFGAGNYLTSDNFQSFDQAQRDFVNAVLRRESGAAISESEFQNARKQYLPQPGDGKVVLDQKAANRKLAIQSLQNSANPVPSMSGAPSNVQSAPATQQAPSGGDTPPPSYTGSNWKYMTPEQRKLWQ